MHGLIFFVYIVYLSSSKDSEVFRVRDPVGSKLSPWRIGTTHTVLCVKMILSLCTCASLRASVYCHSWRIVCGKDVRVDLLPPAPQGSDPTNQRLSGHPLFLQHSSFSLYSTSDVRFPFSSFIPCIPSRCAFSTWSLMACPSNAKMVAVNCISMSLRRWSMLCGNLRQNYITSCITWPLELRET